MIANNQAIFYMLCSTLSLSLSGFFTKVLSVEMSGQLLTFLRLLAPALILLCMVALTHFPKLTRDVYRPVAIRAVCIIGTQYCFIHAMQTLSLVEAVVLFATGPLFIPVLEKLIFAVTIKTKTKIGLLLTFIGVVLMSGISSNIEVKPEYLYGVLSGLFNAGSQVSLFRATKTKVSAATLNFWTFLLAAMGTLPILIVVGLTNTDIEVLSHPVANGWIWLVIFTFGFTIVGNQMFRSKAYRLVESNSELAPLIYTNILFTVVWQYLFFEVTYTYSQLFGISLVLVASVINTLGFNLFNRPTGQLAKK